MCKLLSNSTSEIFACIQFWAFQINFQHYTKGLLLTYKMYNFKFSQKEGTELISLIAVDSIICKGDNRREKESSWVNNNSNSSDC